MVTKNTMLQLIMVEGQGVQNSTEGQMWHSSLGIDQVPEIRSVSGCFMWDLALCTR